MTKCIEVKVAPNKNTGDGHLNKEFKVSFTQPIFEGWLENLIQEALIRENRSQNKIKRLQNKTDK